MSIDFFLQSCKQFAEMQKIPGKNRLIPRRIRLSPLRLSEVLFLEECLIGLKLSFKIIQLSLMLAGHISLKKISFGIREADAVNLARLMLFIYKTRKEDSKMQEKKYSKNFALIGGGVGVVLFAVFGLLTSFFIGGVMGVNLAEKFLGYPLTSAVIGRLIISASIGVSVTVAAIMSIGLSSLAGWLIGTIVETVKGEEKELATAEVK
jgi:hypothetical protein